MTGGKLDNPISEDEAFAAMQVMIDRIAVVEWELFKSDLAGIVMTIAGFLACVLLF